MLLLFGSKRTLTSAFDFGNNFFGHLPFIFFKAGKNRRFITGQATLARCLITLPNNRAILAYRNANVNDIAVNTHSSHMHHAIRRRSKLNISGVFLQVAIYVVGHFAWV